MPKLEWAGIGHVLIVAVAAVVLTAWQTRSDASVFESYFGGANPVAVIVGAVVGGVVAIAYLQAASGFRVSSPGSASHALRVVSWAVPLLACIAIGADLLLRYPRDTHVALPDAIRFYPAMAVLVEMVLHALPLAFLVAVVGPPTGLDATFWRIALPVALIEAALQAGYATNLGTAVFSGTHLVVFGLVQLWMYWRFGFVWMLGFRLAYYTVWHLAWGVARLELLF